MEKTMMWFFSHAKYSKIEIQWITYIWHGNTNKPFGYLNCWHFFLLLLTISMLMSGNVIHFSKTQCNRAIECVYVIFFEEIQHLECVLQHKLMSLSKQVYLRTRLSSSMPYISLSIDSWKMELFDWLDCWACYVRQKHHKSFHQPEK